MAKSYRFLEACSCEDAEHQVNKLANSGWEFASMWWKNHNGQSCWVVVMHKLD